MTYSIKDCDRDLAGEAADCICRAFLWDDTAEGPEFWLGVHARLVQMAGDGVISGPNIVPVDKPSYRDGYRSYPRE